LRSGQDAALFDEPSVNHVAPGPDVARSLATAKSELARFNRPAKFTGQGNPLIKPHGLIDVRGVDSTNDGYWMIREVTHTMQWKGSYSVEGIAVTDGRKASNSSSFRTKEQGLVPTLNLSSYTTNGSLNKPKTPSRSIRVPLTNQSQNTYSVNSGRWM
jgi:hypothetical protein